MKPHQWCNG